MIRKIDKKILYYFEIAAKIAKQKKDCRTYLIGAVGIRSDGAMVMAQNGPTVSPNPKAHAEHKLCRKLNKGSQVFVARIRICDNKFAMAKPCRSCRAVLKSRGIESVMYTIGPDEYGILDLTNKEEYNEEYVAGAYRDGYHLRNG